MMRLWLVTTFANESWYVYARTCLQSLDAHLPHSVKLCVALDDGALEQDLISVLNTSQYELSIGRSADHQAFIAQFKNRDHPTEYRLQAARFCHKIFVLKNIMDKAIALSGDARPTHIIWWDADARLTRAVSQHELEAVMPVAESVSYLGRKDWDHSECGFMGFSLERGGKDIIDFMHMYYVQGLVFSLPQWHDSYLFDVARRGHACKNISEGVPGNNVWAATALGAFSEHWKGYAAKQHQRPSSDAELFKA